MATTTVVNYPSEAAAAVAEPMDTTETPDPPSVNLFQPETDAEVQTCLYQFPETDPRMIISCYVEDGMPHQFLEVALAIPMKFSGLVRDMFGDDLFTEDTQEVPTLNCSTQPTCTRKNMEAIMAFCAHHFDDADPTATDAAADAESKTLPEIVGGYDLEYINGLGQSQGFEIMIAANYLNIPWICMYVVAFKYALQMRGKTPDELREWFNLPDDLTEEEKVEIRKKFVFEE